MARINVNLNDVEGGFEVFPDGKYIVELSEKSKIAKSKEGAAYIRWIAEIIDPEEHAGKLISWSTSLQPQALWNLKNMMEVIDVAFDDDGFEMEDAFGSQLGIVNEVREYDGKDRNNIVEYFAAN